MHANEEPTGRPRQILRVIHCVNSRKWIKDKMKEAHNFGAFYFVDN